MDTFAMDNVTMDNVTMDNVTMDNVTMESGFNCLERGILSSLNITNKTHWEISEELPKGGSIALAVIYIIFFLIAFIWNLFIVVTYLVKYKLLKQPGNLFLFNLALADLLVSVTTMMFSFVAQAAREFVFGDSDVVRCGVCDFAGFSLMFLIFMSFHLLAALSIDRFILLAFPLRYKQLMSLGRAIVVLIIVWVVSFVIAILPFVGFGQYEFNRQYGSCLPRFSGVNFMSKLLNFYYPLFCVLEALIPIIIIAVTNVFTYRLVAKFLKKNIRRKRTFRNPEALAANTEEEKKHKQQQSQLVRVFGALCIANCVSWTPVIVVVLTVAATGALMAVSLVPNGVYVFGWICYLTNPVVHPIIESFFVKDLRYQVKRARTTIRRASTAIIRSTTQKFFNSSALDRANEAVDQDTSTGSKRRRTHKFFNKKMVEKKLKENESSHMDSMQTDEMLMDEMTSAASRTPTPERPRKNLGKVGRSVTFSETGSAPIHLPSPPSEGSGLKSALKRNSDPVVGVSYQKIALKEVDEVISEVDEEQEEAEGTLVENGTGIHIQEEHVMNGTVTTGMESGLPNGTEEVRMDMQAVEESNLANGEVESNVDEAPSSEPEQVHIIMNETETPAETESNLPNGTAVRIEGTNDQSDSLPRTLV